MSTFTRYTVQLDVPTSYFPSRLAVPNAQYRLTVLDTDFRGRGSGKIDSGLGSIWAGGAYEAPRSDARGRPTAVRAWVMCVTPTPAAR